MNKLVHTAEDRADKQTEAEIKNIKGKGQREGGKKKTEGEKEGQGRKGDRGSLPGSLAFSHFASVLIRPDCDSFFNLHVSTKIPYMGMIKCQWLLFLTTPGS